MKVNCKTKIYLSNIYMCIFLIQEKLLKEKEEGLIIV